MTAPTQLPSGDRRMEPVWTSRSAAVPELPARNGAPWYVLAKYLDF